MTQLETRIPFCGFYGSWIDNSITNEIEQIINNWTSESLESDFPWIADYPEKYHPTERSLSGFIWDRLSVDYQTLAQEYCEEFFDWLSETSERKIEFTFTALESPREYNFTTDKIFATISIEDIQYMRESIGEYTLKRMFNELFSHRSGFISSYSTDIPTKTIDEWDYNELYAIILAYTNDIVHTFDSSVILDHRYYYETISRITSDSIDWQKLGDDIREDILDNIAADTLADEEAQAIIADYVPRCPNTLDLFDVEFGL